jgi:integrase
VVRDLISQKPWKRAGQNLLRYTPSGKYYLRCRVAGKLHKRSLNTTVISVAKLRLPDEIKKLRQNAESSNAVLHGKMRFADVVQIYRVHLESRTDIKPRTKMYYIEALNALLKTWPSLNALDVRKPSERDCRAWAGKFLRRYSATRFNNTLSILRNIFDIAIEAGARFDNPAARVKRARVRSKKLRLPTRDQFLQFVDAIANAGSRDSKNCADLVRFLAFSGLRIGEAVHVAWRDVDFGAGKLHVHGDVNTGTKNSESRVVPMIPELKDLLQTLRDAHIHESPTNRVMRVREAQKSMDRAARIIGIDRFTHHDLRHLFATMCIESGVDVPTVSRWLGHKDGGALAMKTYGHLRDEHSLAQAERVSFGLKPSN